MADNGIRTPNLPLGSLIEFLGHAEVAPGVKVVSRIGLDSLRSLLIADGPIDQRLDDIEAALGTPGGGAAYVARLSVVERATQPVTFSGDRPLIVDPKGTLGTARAVYLPRNGYFRQGDREFNGAMGQESPNLAGYSGFGNINPEIIATVYLDIDASPALKLAVYPVQVPTDRPDHIMVLASLWRGQIYTSLPVVHADGMPGKSRRIAPISPLVVESNVTDGRLLLVPQCFVRVPDREAFELFTPPAGQAHWPKGIDTTPLTDTRYFFDVRAARAGSADPIIKVAGDDGAQFGGPYLIPLGAVGNGIFSPAKGLSVVGAGNGGVAPNRCLVTRNAEAARFLYGTTEIDDITDPILRGMGFLRGARDATNFSAYYGEEIVDPIPLGWVNFRYFIQTGTPGDFGAPQAFINRGTNGEPVAVASLTSGTARIEYRRSAQVASVIGRIELPLDISGPLYIQVGADNPSRRDLRFCGLQFSMTREPMSWIARSDYGGPTAASSALARLPAYLGEADRDSAVVAPDLFMVQGRPLALRLTNCMSARVEGRALVSNLTSLPSAPGGDVEVVSGDGVIRVDADKVGPSARLVLRRAGPPYDIKADIGLRCWVSPSGGYSQTVRILLIGDSLTNRRIAAFLDAKLRAMGITPIFLGTMPGAGLADTDWANGTGGPLGEGREGWQWADYTNQSGRFTPIGQNGQDSVAAYNALSKNDKNFRNPFVFPASAGPGVYGGYKFNFGQYLARFGFAVPDYVFIALAQNDEALAGSPAAATQQVVNGLNAVVPSIRAAGAGIQIGIGLHTRPRGLDPDLQQIAYRYPNLRAIAAHVRAVNDPKLKFVGLHQHMDENAPWTMATAINPNSVGLARTYVLDSVHFGDEQRHVVAELIRNWIAWGVSGGTAYGVTT